VPAEAAASTTPAASEAPAADDARGAARPRRAWLPLAAVGMAVAVLAGLAGALAWQLRQQALAEEAAQDAIAAARDAGRVLFSYDHNKLEADFEKGLALTTGDFRKEYRRTTAEVVTPVAEQYDAVVVAEVVEAAVVAASADEVTALVFLNQGTTSTRVQGQQVDQSRVRMRLVERGGRWLVEEVTAL
jgi:Mce-associated membrane protein